MPKVIKTLFIFSIKWAEKLLAKELVSSGGGPSCQYHILLTKIKLAKNQLEEAEKQCADALSYDYLVTSLNKNSIYKFKLINRYSIS
jgi:hypothetical protein